MGFLKRADMRIVAVLALLALACAPDGRRHEGGAGWAQGDDGPNPAAVPAGLRGREEPVQGESGTDIPGVQDEPKEAEGEASEGLVLFVGRIFLFVGSLEGLWCGEGEDGDWQGSEGWAGSHVWRVEVESYREQRRARRLDLQHTG